jgi:hypothetical protein
MKFNRKNYTTGFGDIQVKERDSFVQDYSFHMICSDLV